mmetsp:Transcript_19200/g.24257  ORF Transcript_19200/g.24257 Transcript_19200/m.24257 type:complete len:91 (+) Transcript_19200:410-682(+)
MASSSQKIVARFAIPYYTMGSRQGKQLQCTSHASEARPTTRALLAWTGWDWKNDDNESVSRFVTKYASQRPYGCYELLNTGNGSASIQEL